MCWVHLVDLQVAMADHWVGVHQPELMFPFARAIFAAQSSFFGRYSPPHPRSGMLGARVARCGFSRTLVCVRARVRVLCGWSRRFGCNNVEPG
jgi:hypothetical protein